MPKKYDKVRRKGTRVLRCKLTNDERLAMSNQIADAVLTGTRLEDDLNSVKKQFQAKIQEQASKVAAKSEVIRSGFELRQVETEVVLDYESGRATEVRKDTGEVIEDRELLPDELQMLLDGSDAQA